MKINYKAMKKYFAIALLLVSIPLYSQTGPGWGSIRYKVNFRDTLNVDVCWMLHDTIITPGAKQFNYLHGLTSNVQAQFNGLVPYTGATGHVDIGGNSLFLYGSLSTALAPIADAYITDLWASEVHVSSSITLGATELTPSGEEFNFVDGVTSPIQTQFNNITSDTIPIQNIVKIKTDTIPLVTFGLGSGQTGDTIVFQNNALAGSFFNESSDTLAVTNMMAILAEGTGTETVSVQVSWHGTFKSGSATNLNATALAITSITTGTEDVAFANSKIPPNVFVWCAISGISVGNRPSYLNVTLSGYRITNHAH